jgi:hypothetical protein
MTENEEAFILGLEKLTRETGIEIGGCGCCGSPSIDKLGADEMPEEAGYYVDVNNGNVSWTCPSREYSWQEDKGRIVRDTKPKGE